MKYALLALAGAGLLSTQASAQEQRFPGARLEVVGGWDRTSATIRYEDSAAPANNFEETGNTNGIVYGVNAGYDLQVGGGGYIGIEGGIEFSDNSRCEEVFGGDAACFALKRNFFVGGRAGMRVASSTLFYAGVAYVNGKAEVSYSDPADPSYDFAYDDQRGGYRLSAGLEHRLVRNLYMKVEYRYSNYHNYTYAAGTESVTLAFDRNQIVAGLGARF